MTTYNMQAPSGVVGIVQGTASGTTYTISANGTVSGVVQADYPSLLAAGFTTLTGSTPLPHRLSLFGLRNSDGTVLPATAASGKWGLSITAGTSQTVTTEFANNGTVTDTALAIIGMDSGYISGQDVTLTANAVLTLAASAVASTKSLTVHAWKMNDAGTVTGSDLCNIGSTVGTVAADMTFVITGSALSPADQVLISAVGKVVETATHNASIQLNSLRWM